MRGVKLPASSETHSNLETPSASIARKLVGLAACHLALGSVVIGHPAD
jgi:hypothetical protein